MRECGGVDLKKTLAEKAWEWLQRSHEVRTLFDAKSRGETLWDGQSLRYSDEFSRRTDYTEKNSIENSWEFCPLKSSVDSGEVALSHVGEPTIVRFVHNMSSMCPLSKILDTSFWDHYGVVHNKWIYNGSLHGLNLSVIDPGIQKLFSRKKRKNSEPAKNEL